MVMQKVVFIVAFVLFSSLFAFNNAVEEISSKATEVKKKIDVAVEGVVSCQSCSNYGTWSLNKAKPIPSAKVSVTCKDHKDRVTFYKVFATDANGYFYGQLEGFKMDNYILDHPLHSCVVRLVSSPLANCNHFSNINYGIDGCKLRFKNKMVSGPNYEAVEQFRSGVVASDIYGSHICWKLVKIVGSTNLYESDLVESDLVAMAEGPNATDPAQVLAPQVGGPSVNPRPLNTRTRLDQLEDKMQALSGIIDQVTTLEERLDGFSDDQAHVGERLITLEGVVEGNMATLLDQVAELSSKSSSQSQQRAGSSNNYNKGKNGGYQARSGGDQGYGQNRSGGASAGGASSSNSGREYHRLRNNGGASSSSRFQGRPGNLKCFLCGGNHKAYQCPQKTALNALMASHGDQADDTTQGNDSGLLGTSVSSAARAKLDFKLVCVTRREVKRFSATFKKIHAVLDNAEKQQIKDESVKLWIEEVKEVAYDIDDVLDECVGKPEEANHNAEAQYD
ncbi:hypothetical protein GIB67_017082 [Kingdonia uniflora]|uniref:Disease resistance N-terminal domain-containing protein n=1 Tax=Kingdonia uniflora TaxID=39325 RepID=A0A7J7NC95_9MAGN|nr:hypothetical protein GIB67_017082 [Kingdonia uniflora]